jgi:hypothetical protein
MDTAIGFAKAKSHLRAQMYRQALSAMVDYFTTFVNRAIASVQPGAVPPAAPLSSTPRPTSTVVQC